MAPSVCASSQTDPSGHYADLIRERVNLSPCTRGDISKLNEPRVDKGLNPFSLSGLADLIPDKVRRAGLIAKAQPCA